MLEFSTLDFFFFGSYLVLIVFVAYRASRKKGGDKERSAEDYFLAGRSLPWWVIGASIIASNISAEQMIGMSGSGYVIGLAMATYEWIAALMLIIIAKYFLPVFLQKKIFTIPGYLKLRFNKKVSMGLSVFWIMLYVFVNLTSVLYLGGLAVQSFVNIPLEYAILALALFSMLYSLYGGLSSVAWTDVLQVSFLIVGGIIVTYISVNKVSGDEGGVIEGFRIMVDKAPEHFKMILSKDNPSFQQIPGIRILIGGLWVLGMSYWGCSQYITQRAFAGKSLKDAQNGMLFAGYLKLLLPLIVVVPGIAAYVLNIELDKPDEVYPLLLASYMPVGIKGVVFAALIAAVASSVSSMVNSTSIIFTMDIYQNLSKKELSQQKLVRVGRISGAIALVIALIIAPLLSSIEQVFQFIQEYTGFVSPAILVLFLFGIFWPKMTSKAAMYSILLSIPLSVMLKFGFPNMPFLDRVGIVFLLLCVISIIVSLKSPSKEYEPETYPDFSTSRVFNILSLGIIIILGVLYYTFW